MFHDNLNQLRKINHMSQEELAEKIDVSRQTLSKWETGVSLPDIEKCKLLADVFGVTLDDLVNYESTLYGLGVPPRGKHAFGVVFHIIYNFMLHIIYHRFRNCHSGFSTLFNPNYAY